MTAKEYLMQVRYLDAALRTKENELAKLRSDIYSLQAVNYNKDIVTGGNPIHFADKVAKLNDLAARINDEWDTLIAIREEARSYINVIPAVTLRAVLIERYINVKRWEQIACDLNYTYRRVIQLHGTALKEFEKVFPIISHS